MFGDKLKQVISNKQDGEKKNNRKIENLVFFVILLIITIVIINIVWNGSEKTNKQENVTSNKQLASTQIKENASNQKESEIDLEVELESILSKIQGVGEVKAFINYSESSQVVAMYNETTKTSNTQENDTSGGTRTIEEVDSQKDIIYEENDGTKKPITQKVIQPKVEGAIITAKGANNPETKANIIQAVEAVTGLATHKIQVFEMN